MKRVSSLVGWGRHTVPATPEIVGDCSDVAEVQLRQTGLLGVPEGEPRGSSVWLRDVGGATYGWFRLNHSYYTPDVIPSLGGYDMLPTETGFTLDVQRNASEGNPTRQQATVQCAFDHWAFGVRVSALFMGLNPDTWACDQVIALRLDGVKGGVDDASYTVAELVRLPGGEPDAYHDFSIVLRGQKAFGEFIGGALSRASALARPPEASSPGGAS